MISFCPLCDAKIRLPQSYEAATRCRCPECRETFQIAQLLAMDAPAVHVVEIDSAADDLVMEELADLPLDADDLLATSAREDSDILVSLDAITSDQDIPEVSIPHESQTDLIDVGLGDDLLTDSDPEDELDFAELLQSAEDRVAEELEEETIAKQTAEAEVDFELDDLTDVIPTDADGFAEFSEMIEDDEALVADADSAEELPDFDFGALDESESAVAHAEAPGIAETVALAESEGEPPIRTVPAFQFRPAEEKENVATGKRGRSVRRSPVMEVAQVLLGGVLACIIVQFILWWLPEKWRRDPIGLAKKLPDAVSFLAPANLRSPQVRLNPNTPAVADNSDPLPDEPLDETGEESASTDARSADLGDSFAQAQNDARDRTDLADSDVSAPASDIPAATTDDLVTPATYSEDAATSDALTATPETDAPVVEAPVGPVDAPLYSRNDLAAALAAARDATETINTIKTDKTLSLAAKKEAVATFTAAMSQLAETITFTTPNGSNDTIEAVQTFLAELAADPDMSRYLTLAGTNRLAAESEGGVALVGKIVRISSVGSLQEMQVEAQGKTTMMVTVVTVSSPSAGPAGQEGETIIVCGRLIDSPLTSLASYTGQATRVVWARHLFPVSK